MIVRLAVAMTAADGRITPNELSAAQQLDRLGLGPLSALAHAFALLGVRPGASRVELENAYRAALERYNPNKAIDLGTEFASLAVQKLAQATAASEFVLAAAEDAVV